MGWMLVSSCANIICKSRFSLRLFTIIGQNSIYTLFLHFLAFKIINYVQVFLYGEETYLVASFPTLYVEGVWWIAYTLVGVVVPTMFGLLVKQRKILLQKLYYYINSCKNSLCKK